ncbi:AAA family ATPase, partial [Candidatus Bathyarchaeota archaeon]|nr:AAA family ATPase [Candidatus Bathyarchaeota archaeon]
MDSYKFRDLCGQILNAVDSIFVGNPLLLRKVLCAALANGHILFEDYPGLGKTLLAKVFAKVLGCKWARIQFTPDLMPADIVGTRVWKANISEFVLEKGPIFTNILLADEINRAPPKTQSALLEAMEERQVTIEGVTHRLESPFFVMATQNPIELEGTYPLPEAQLDRFLVRLSTGYVESLNLECEILRRRIKWQRDDPTELIEPVISPETFREMQNFVEKDVYIDQQ